MLNIIQLINFTDENELYSKIEALKDQSQQRGNIVVNLLIFHS